MAVASDWSEISDIDIRRKRRKLSKPNFYNVRAVQRSSAPERWELRKALEKSKFDKGLAGSECPEAPTFRPSMDEFSDPIRYLSSISEEASKFGICKIIPPKEWKLPPPHIDTTVSFSTRLQVLHQLQEAKEFDDGKNYTFEKYKAMTEKFSKFWFEKNPASSPANIEEVFWRMVETAHIKQTVEYANDLRTRVYNSGFPRVLATSDSTQTSESTQMTGPPEYARSWFNLNNLPRAPGCVLGEVSEDVEGMNVPWLYLGMLFATFCWHNEDHHLNSCSYNHQGAPKTWYGIPGDEAQTFESVVRKQVPLLFKQKPDLLHRLNYMVSPAVLKSNDCPVYHLLQQPGEFVITWPAAYHAGFSHGFKKMIVNIARNVEKYPRLGEKDLNVLVKILKRETDFLQRRLDRAIRDGMAIYGLHEVALKDANFCECSVCKQHAFFGVVLCPCSPTKVACLHHCAKLCKCDVKRKVIALWHGPSEFQGLITKLEQRISKYATKSK